MAERIASFPLKIIDSDTNKVIEIDVSSGPNISGVKMIYSMKMYGHATAVTLSYKGTELAPDSATLMKFGITEANVIPIWGKKENDEVCSWSSMWMSPYINPDLDRQLVTSGAQVAISAMSTLELQ